LQQFNLIVDSQIFKINFDLFCCLSNHFFEIKGRENTFICSIPDNHLECFHQLMLIFEGQPFIFEDEHFSSLMFLIDYFGFYDLLSIIKPFFLFSQNLEESIYFLSKPYCYGFSQPFDHSFSNLVQSINQIAFEQFQQFDNFILISIFSSRTLRIPNEDFLFQFIIEMMNIDINKKILLQTIHFSFVSSNMLINFFQDYFLDDLDSYCFENLKERLFCDIAKPNTEIPIGRWSQNSHFISREGIEEIFQFCKIILEKVIYH
jgi:hypothetical protein